MSDDMVRLRIRLMGPPEISAGGNPLVVPQIKSRALLYYLAATGESHTRDHLATLLWSESGQSEAYHSLRSSLYHLRKALQAVQAKKVLSSARGLLSLDMTSCPCNVV